ncbi:CDP-glycerol glycerophosphotransferase family protein [Bacillus pumilus]|nr:CDP-glycerol glycerophosphotransferase family protein [Bacillus pumilus]
MPFKDLHHVWVINDFSDPMIAELKQKSPNISFVKVDSNEYLKYLATSKYLVNDTSFPFYFIKREEQIYINTWHGTPLKTLGKDIKKDQCLAIKISKEIFFIVITLSVRILLRMKSY